MKECISLVNVALLLLCLDVHADTKTIEKFNRTKASIKFTQNKGQVSDQNYKARPDVLFYGEAQGLNFHIRKDGISYQTSEVVSWKQDELDRYGDERIGEEFDSIPDQISIYRTDINWIEANKDFTTEKGESTQGYNRRS